jgi:acetyltransferase-like isoleucine patch superfamily enzyme
MDVKKMLIGTGWRLPFIQKLWQKLTNDISTGSNTFSCGNIHFRHNTVRLKGTGQCVEAASESYCRDTGIIMEGSGNTVRIREGSVLADHTRISVRGSGNTVEIGKGCSLRASSVFIAGNNNHVLFEGNNSAFGLDIHMEQDGNRIEIGQGSTFHGREGQHVEMVLEEATSIVIGQDCMFSNGIRMRTSDSHSITDLEGRRLNPGKDIRIGDHCWIGLGAILLKGSSIPSRCIVGAGAVVNRGFEKENCIYAGNPAAAAKEGRDWDRKFILERPE